LREKVCSSFSIFSLSTSPPDPLPRRGRGKKFRIRGKLGTLFNKINNSN
jgi:hypothetical protein